MATVEVYYIDNDNMIELSGVRDAANGTYLNNASLDLTVVDAGSDLAVDGEVWPVTMTYVNGSDGRYRATIVHGLVVSEFQHLIAKIEGAPSGLELSLRIPLIAMHRDGSCD